MRQRERALVGYFNRNVLEQYRNLQRKRWITENASEGQEWAALNPTYSARKRRQFASYPGRGTKKLVATNRLFRGVIGPGEDFRKVVTSRGLYIATITPYAKYVNEDRNFTDWSTRSEHELKVSVAQFIFKGILKQSAELI
jgi:hypothetical protein